MDNLGILDKNCTRAWLEISKSAIDNNIAQYKKIIGNKTLAPVIKSNAYGHGMLEVAKICEQNKDVDWLCVANADEAISLRKNGITKNILVLSYIGPFAQQAIAQDISLIAYDLDTVTQLNSIAKNIGKKANLHIKIDTGLSRFGVLPEQAVSFIKHIKSNTQNLDSINHMQNNTENNTQNYMQNNTENNTQNYMQNNAKYFEFINIEGIWTHFTEPALENREFTNLQATKFSNVIKELEKINIKIPFVHCSNSAGALTINLDCDNFYRPGVSLYGYWPSEYIKNFVAKNYPDFKLTPCMTFKTSIFSIKNIPAGSLVGYMRTFQAKRDTKLAIIPIGYYDGYDRRFSNTGHVLINGQACKIAGLICMNAMMIDVTDVKNVKIGDQAILIGEAPEININTMASATSMNPRDITSKISLEIPRVIVG